MSRTAEDIRFHVIDDKAAQIYRNMSPARRVEIVANAHETMRLLLHGRIMTDHPQWTLPQINAEIARRLLGDSA